MTQIQERGLNVFDAKKNTLIFIDDEESILSSIARVFRKEGYEVLTTTKPEQVFQWLIEKEVSVLISDQRMPIMAGVEVLKTSKNLSLNTIRVMLTGYADMQSAIEAVNQGNIFSFLTKPWNEENLKTAIRNAVNQFNLVSEVERLGQVTKTQNAELRSLNAHLEDRVIERTKQITDLNKRLELSLLECVKVMGGLAEYSGALPSGHAKRVSRYAGGIAKELGATRERLDIQVAAYLHDIGKVGLKGNDTNHPIKGAEFVRMVPGLEGAALCIQHLYERVDGKGTPSQLIGDQIPLGARIIAVANAYDKALNLGPSPERMTPRKAIDLLLEKRGQEFEEGIIFALQAYLKSSSQFSDELSEIEIEIYELKPGMILSRPIVTRDGRALLGADTMMNRDILSRLWKKHREIPVNNDVFVYREKKTSTKKAA